uniref:Putative ATP-binding protein n=1 Tax=Candidatus Methanogaster sp. ANME-2c ERB4 TaxID=2759911 RepID=A0A7G9YP38_9EURY|nr:putative ATP-binding protein [Methanosarcinales archaeon ANME-2c ERB4]QNO50124.1 putative ATP-binding protein [Methanosarcinales archaeon ANME-2c ERB4]
MKRIEFHDREKETKEIRDILNSEPSLITFVYGPINSGKTALVTHLIKHLPENYVVFYINLRGKFISDYDDFVRALFKLDREKKEYKEILKSISEVSLKSLKFAGIPVTEDILDLFFREKTYEDVFEFLEDYFTEIAENRVPVLIVDELQKIGDVRINTYLIYELFNLFIRLTKELHLCHVFAVTSDSLFIERVYSEAMLDGRCRHLMVDDFDYEATTAFLERYDFTDEEKKMAWDYCGGKPVCLVELINRKLRGSGVKEQCEDILKIRVSQMRDLLDLLDYVKPQVLLEDEKYNVEREHVVEILKDFIDQDIVSFEGYRPEKHFLIKKNILFLDPKEGLIRPQSRLNLLAIRKVIKDA